jgi:hypothetical protein
VKVFIRQGDRNERSYSANTRYTFLDGRHHIDCIKGLWGVNAENLQDAEREAKHYFIQYYGDGEYSEGGPSAESLVENFKSAIGNTRVLIIGDSDEQ